MTISNSADRRWWRARVSQGARDAARVCLYSADSLRRSWRFLRARLHSAADRIIVFVDDRAAEHWPRWLAQRFAHLVEPYAIQAQLAEWADAGPPLSV